MLNNQLNTNEYLSNCDPKDVISFNNQQWVSVAKFKSIVYDGLRNSGVDSTSKRIAEQSEFKNINNTNALFFQGGECEILRAGSKGWQKGKIKINVTLEFIPDEVEEDKSPLDDIRQADINNPAQQ